jgi:hypothetical protein
MEPKQLIIIGAMFAGLLVLKWVLGNLSRGGGKENTATAKTFPYGLRDAFLSPAEISFFHVLKGILSADQYLVTKVRLEDLFFVRQPHKNRNARNLIAQKHVDFVICDVGSMQPLLGIELDDASHKKPETVERDRFVERVFGAAELPLMRVKAARGYVPGEIKARIREELGLDVPPLPPYLNSEGRAELGEI